MFCRIVKQTTNNNGEGEGGSKMSGTGSSVSVSYIEWTSVQCYSYQLTLYFREIKLDPDEHRFELNTLAAAFISVFSAFMEVLYLHG